MKIRKFLGHRVRFVWESFHSRKGGRGWKKHCRSELMRDRVLFLCMINTYYESQTRESNFRFYRKFLQSAPPEREFW